MRDKLNSANWPSRRGIVLTYYFVDRLHVKGLNICAAPEGCSLPLAMEWWKNRQWFADQSKRTPYLNTHDRVYTYYQLPLYLIRSTSNNSALRRTWFYQALVKEPIWFMSLISMFQCIYKKVCHMVLVINFFLKINKNDANRRPPIIQRWIRWQWT